MRSIFFSLIAFISLIPVAVFAQNGGNNNLVNLPIGETGDFNDYINAVYLMFISIAALIAVVKIIIAGVKYMFSDIVTQKSDAKNDIKGALLGLLVVLSAVVILTIINPDLTTFDPDITRTERREQIDTREQQRIANEDEAIATCVGSSICEVTNCNGDCTAIAAACATANRTSSMIGDNRAMACFGAEVGSIVERETDSGNALLNEYLTSEDDVSNVVEIYAINQRVQGTNEDVMITEEMIQAWFLECVENEDGTDTGNTFVDEQNDVQATAVRACVN
jgi:hypothetical protein